MDLLFEIIIELLLEGGEEICANKKISKWIRYPILFVMILFFSIVIFGIIFAGISVIKDSIVAGLFLVAIGLTMLIWFIHGFRKQYIKKLNKNKEDKI